MKSQKTKDKVWVQKNGRIYSMPITLKKGRAAQEEVLELVAPFTCKVLKIHVASGQELKKGQAVLVVEAMKMEYSYTSPRDGIVQEILVAPGEIVESGKHFIKWKP